MVPKPTPGFENLWMNSKGEAFERRDGALAPLPVSRSTQYDRVSVLVSGKRERIHVHVLMAVTFLGLDRKALGQSSDSLQVDHRNCDKRDNRLENLEVVTRGENCSRAWKAGRYARNGYASKGRPKMGLRKFSPADVTAMSDMRSQGLSYREIGRRMGCDHKAVYRILKGDTYQSWS